MAQLNACRILLTCLFVAALAACGESTDLDSAMAKAEKFVADGQYQGAFVELKSAAQTYPDAIEPRRRLAELYIRFGDGASAQKEIERAQAAGLSEGDATPLLVKALLLLGRPGDAIGRIEKVPDFATSADYLSLYGYALAAQNRLDPAAEKFAAALALDANHPAALLGTAALAAEHEELEQALALSERALAAAPQNYEVQIAHAQFLLDLNRPGSREAFVAAGRLNPFTPAPRIGEARSLIAEKKYSDARTVLEGAHKRFPKSLAVSYYLGATAFLDGKDEEAVELFRGVLSKMPNHALSQYYLGVLMYRQGKLEQAEDYIRLFTRAYPRYLPARKLLASIQIKRRKPKDALATLTEGVAADVTDAQLLNLRAGAHLAAGELEQGIAELEKSYALAPGDRNTKASLIISQLQSGEGDEATHLLSSELELDQDVETNSL